VIAFVDGILAEKRPGVCVIEAHGVGYEIQVSLSTFHRLPPAGEALRLLTYFHVREDGQQLFGFMAPAEKDAFCLLLNVKGVGPKVALNILSGLAPADLREAVKKRRLTQLTALAGVGKKLAERLLLELSDKVDGLALGEAGLYTAEGSAAGERQKAEQALLTLGYSAAVAREAVAKAMAQLEPAAKVEEIVRTALKFA
jgi:holliday junction DNA helicase RuvA